MSVFLTTVPAPTSFKTGGGGGQEASRAKRRRERTMQPFYFQGVEHLWPGWAFAETYEYQIMAVFRDRVIGLLKKWL